MALQPGYQLGTYEILALIGAGGMGEVYKARDPKLNRMVAIKVLPPGLAGDAALLARFEREAKAVAALSHPNILGIHDLASQGGITYAVMELLEGDSLRDRLKAGALPPKRAVEIAIELAQGLGAAHDKGIVHRDVKPENIFITKEGRVKVLDFGLAKQVAPRGGLGVLETEAVGAPHPTEAGMVLGTAGYMSPEQVRGEAADHRADIFAFGVVLYEMLSGQRPFQGATSAQTMTAILEQDPPALVASRGPLPPALERLVAHCLEKHPEGRFQAAKDLAYDLQNLSTLTSDPAGRAPAPRPHRPLALGLVLGAALVLLAAGLLAALQWPPFRPAGQPTFTRLTHVPGTIEAACFAPDGRTIYYSERIQGGPPELFVLHPGSPSPRALGVKDARVLGVSPTGVLAVLMEPRPFFGATQYGTLAQVDGETGSVKRIREGVLGAAWDGLGFATIAEQELTAMTLEFAGKVVARANPGMASYWYPRLAPDGGLLALIMSDGVKTEIVTYDRQGRRALRLRKREDALGESFTGLAWGPGGNLWLSELVDDQTVIWSLAPDGRRRMLWRGEGSKALLDVSREGRMLVADQQSRRGVSVQRAGEAAAQDVSIGSGTQAFGFSADGRQLLLMETPNLDGGTAQDQTYLWTSGGGPPVRVALGTAMNLSPDGRWVGMSLNGIALADLDPAVAEALRQAGVDPRAALDLDDPAQFLLFMPSGTGVPFARAVPKPLGGVSGGFLVAGGKRFLFEGLDHGEAMWFSLDRQGGAPRALTPPGWGTTYAGLDALSPDETRLIVGRNGQFSILDVATRELQPIHWLGPDERPTGWGRDGRSLYIRTTHPPYTVSHLDLATGARRPVFTYQPGDTSGLMQVRSIYTDLDGQIFAVSYVRELTNLYLMEGAK